MIECAGVGVDSALKRVAAWQRASSPKPLSGPALQVPVRIRHAGITLPDDSLALAGIRGAAN